MTAAPYESAARYHPVEVALLALNGCLDGELDAVNDLLAEMTATEATRLLPALLSMTDGALRMLDPWQVELWRYRTRDFLAGWANTPTTERPDR